MNRLGAAYRLPLLLAVAASIAAAGCRTVTESVPRAGRERGPASPGDDRRRATNAPRTLPLEVVFVRHDPRDPAFGAELWTHVDEQALDVDLRRRLAANGLRAGVVTGRLPADIATRLEPAAVDPSAPEDAGLRRIVRLLPGKRSDVIAVAGIDELVLLERGVEGVRGATYRDATALVTLRAWPDTDGRVRVTVVPELRHGAVRRSWVGEDGMFRLETGQARHAFDSLGITAHLPAGGLLLVGTADGDGSAIGDALLRERTGSGARFLVVRPLTAATDPLFATAGEPTEATSAGD